MKLQDVAGFINVGQILPRVEAKEGDNMELLPQVRILQPKAIQQGRVELDEISTIRVKQAVQLRKVTMAGDIIMKLSTPYDTAFIAEESEGLVFTSFCAVIRDIKRDQLDPAFLVAYLNMDYTKEMLRLKSAATSLPIVKISDIRELEIPDISLQKQKLLGEAYRISAEQIATLKKMQMNENKLIQGLILDEVKRWMNGKG